MAFSEAPENPKEVHSPIASLYSVVARPEKYAGRHVTLFGYYDNNAEKTATFLFVSEDHAMHHDTTSAIVVAPGKIRTRNLFDSCGGQYIRISGTIQIVEGLNFSMETLTVLTAPDRALVSRTDGSGPQCWPPPSIPLRH